MPGKAVSKARHARLASATQSRLYELAVDHYRAEQQKPRSERKGARAVCSSVSKQHHQDTGETVHLSHSTLLRLAQGGRSQAAFNASKRRLEPAEDAILLQYIIELANRGFPLSYRRIAEHANELLQARSEKEEEDFEPVGKNWSERWVEQHATELAPYWSRTLDKVRGKAVNPITNAAWWKMYREIVEEHGILPENIWTADETGFSTGQAARERVIAKKGKSVQHQVRGGSRENITALVSVSVVGRTIPPLVLFKGQAFQVSWRQDNPLDATMGYSKKGWITGEVTSQYVSIFADQTKPATSSQPRLLIVDGHASHYSRGFLEGALKNNIHVICYPSHTTHVFQALDVSLFGPLKAAFVQERDRYEREHHESVSKKSFLHIFAAALLRVFTKENIQKAMAAAGTWPINEDIVTASVLAPSLETSWRAAMPLPQPTPVRRMARLLEINRREDTTSDSPPNTPIRQRTRSTAGTDAQVQVDSSLGQEMRRPVPAEQSAHAPIVPLSGQQTDTTRTINTSQQSATHNLESISEEVHSGNENESGSGRATASIPETPRTSLRTTSMAYLVNESPITTRMKPPRPVRALQPSWNVPLDVLAHEPRTETERVLLNALQKAESVIQRERTSAVSAQATMVLQNAYVNRVKGQLAAAEEKRKSATTKGRLLADGMPHVLTSSEFLSRVDAHHAAAATEEDKKRKRSLARASWQLAVSEWELLDVERRTRNEQLVKDHCQAIQQWQEDRDRAKSGGEGVRTKKPVRGPLEPARPKPRFKNYKVNSEEEREDFTEILEAIGPEEDEEDEEEDD